MLEAMFNSVISSWLLISRAASIICWPSDFDTLLLQRKKHRRLADIKTQRHVGDAFFFQKIFDLLCGLLEQADLGANRSAHSGIPCANVVLMQPRAIDPMMTRRRAEVPNPRVTGSRKQTISDQL